MKSRRALGYLTIGFVIGLFACDGRSRFEYSQDRDASISLDRDAHMHALDASAVADDLDTSEAITVSACRALGGSAIGVTGVRGDIGSPVGNLSRNDSCPTGRSLIAAIEEPADDDGGLCCKRPPALAFAECVELGGSIVLDIGDGSSYRNGCLGGGDLLGWLDDSACSPLSACGEGGICCR